MSKCRKMQNINEQLEIVCIHSIFFFSLCKLSNESFDVCYSYLHMYGYKISCSLCALVLDYCQPKSVSFCGRVTRLICLRLLRKSPFIYLMSAVTFGVGPYISLWSDGRLDLNFRFSRRLLPELRKEVNYKYHEIMKFFCKRAQPGIEPAIPCTAAGCSTIELRCQDGKR